MSHPERRPYNRFVEMMLSTVLYCTVGLNTRSLRLQGIHSAVTVLIGIAYLGRPVAGVGGHLPILDRCCFSETPLRSDCEPAS
jgi:hypothetical protein